MATSYTTLLGFALPTTGELSGTWGDIVNASITQLVEDSVAGVATTSVASGDWTLTTTGSGADNQARKAILIPTGSSGTTRNINAPKSSKAYFVINSSTGSVVVRGGPTSPTTGVTITAGSQAIVAWNGSDFVNLTPAGLVSGGALGTPSSGTLSSCTVDGTDAVGFRNIPVNSQSAAYTAVLADSGKCIFHPSTDANARTFTIPANGSVAYPIGTAISFVNMTSQVVSIAITTDTMYLAGTGTTGTRSLAQYGTATALKLTSTTWIISGAGLT